MGSTHWRVYSPIWDCSWASACRSWGPTIRHDSFAFIIKLLKLYHYFPQLPLSLLFLDWALANRTNSLSIDEIASTWSSRILTTDSFPVLLEIRLDVLQAIKSWHLTWFLRRWSLISLALSLRRQLGGHLAGETTSSCLGFRHVLLSPLVSLWWWLSSLTIPGTAICVMCRILAISKNNRVISKQLYR